ncbi:hypothetical protein FQA39_LY09101 [Lamprigera yunnana]|nr:hypothetical protein FQA39_LY09101 [Lamprigera yunnana]
MKQSKDANKVDDRGIPIEREKRPAGYIAEWPGYQLKPRGHEHHHPDWPPSEKLDTTAENDNDGSADATVALPTTRAAEDEVFIKEERPADFNNKGPLENDLDDNTQEEEPEYIIDAEEEERASETANNEVEEDIILEGKVGEREMQVLPTAQCDLRPMESDPRQRGGRHTNGGSAESTNQATPRWKRARRDPSDHSRRRSRCANTGIPRARHAEDGMVSKRIRPTSDGNSATRDYNHTVKVPADAENS